MPLTAGPTYQLVTTEMQNNFIETTQSALATIATFFPKDGHGKYTGLETLKGRYQNAFAYLLTTLTAWHAYVQASSADSSFYIITVPAKTDEGEKTLFFYAGYTQDPSTKIYSWLTPVPVSIGTTAWKKEFFSTTGAGKDIINTLHSNITHIESGATQAMRLLRTLLPENATIQSPKLQIPDWHCENNKKIVANAKIIQTNLHNSFLHGMKNPYAIGGASVISIGTIILLKRILN